MSIRPIDLQVMVQKSADISKLNQNDVERPSVNYQQFTDKLQKEVEHNEQSVVNTNKSEQNAVDKDGRGNASGGGAKKRRKDRDKKDENKDGKKANDKSMFDVSI